MPPRETPEPPPLTARVWLRAGLVGLVAFFWVTLFWFRPARRWPGWDTWRTFLHATIHELTGVGGAGAWMIRSVFFVLLAVVLTKLLLKRPLLLGLPDLRSAPMRLVGVALLVALPVQLALGAMPGMHASYAKLFGDAGPTWIAANALNIVFEHMFVEGVVLGAALPLGVLALAEPARVGRFASIGLGFPEAGPRTLSSWLGVAPAAWPAILAQGLIFFLNHFTKNPFEIATSLPGGIAVGWLTLRTRSFWPGMLLHLVTGAVVLGTIALLR